MSYKPMLQALSGTKPVRTPVWFMRQAGRYLPEYRELRAKHGGFMDMALTPESAVEITMQPLRRFDVDAAIIFSDILMVPYGLGQRVEFVQGEGPKLEALESEEDLSRLSFDNFHERLQPVYDALAGVRDQLQEKDHIEKTLIGFAGAPWTVATYMIEGGSSKDFMKTKALAYDDRSWFGSLIDILIDSTAQYLFHQINHGAEVLQIFDSWSGALDPDHFRKWVIEPTKEIVERVHGAFPDIPIIGFPKGASHDYAAYVKSTKVTGIGIDSRTAPAYAAQNLQSHAVLQGNLDPAYLLAGGNRMEFAAEKIMREFSRGPFIFNLGHGINKETPIEHVHDLIRFIRGFEQ